MQLAFNTDLLLLRSVCMAERRVIIFIALNVCYTVISCGID